LNFHHVKKRVETMDDILDNLCGGA
jgi:hypothetical protein